jgi:hypothetical protein
MDACFGGSPVVLAMMLVMLTAAEFELDYGSRKAGTLDTCLAQDRCCMCNGGLLSIQYNSVLTGDLLERVVVAVGVLRDYSSYCSS